MALYFITGNRNKFAEANSVLPEVQQIDIDLPEIQDIDATEIVEAKLLEALKQKEGEFIVEDTSLYFDCLNGLPGPLIKWFLKTIGNKGLFDIVDKLGDNKAEAKTIIGYAKNKQQVHFFEGLIKGKIVPPRGDSNFGWDPIFQPEGCSKTFAEMSSEEKNAISMRRVALNKLKEFINKEK
ncbi:RdgB/HAM1 family non-canonical purine NTP pyrophosphatase [Candidatus Parcubacteria bacterium]|nr:RdgB/HAM1 family non-canonical purine NTP pyrophosphatase [Candidatus Parcubacteria bacterium]